MDLSLRFGDRCETVEVPEENILGILTPVPQKIVDVPLQPVINSATEFIEKYQRILILVNDYTRPTPNQPFLTPLLPVLCSRQTKILVGLGTHRKATEDELKTILGSDTFSALSSAIVQHDARDRSALFFLGKTSFNTDVFLNRQILWADAILTINSIEPHYFAGYTGGRKCFIPGCAAYETTIHNHNLLLHPASAPLSLKNNPVHLDMTEAAKMVAKPLFSIQIVQDANHRILSVHYGDLFSSFENACADAYRLFALPIKEKADIVLSILQPPYDINFYQSQRALEFGIYALKDGGIQITVSRCHQGIGNDEFIRVLSICNQPNRLLQGEKSDHPGWYKAARLARAMQKAKLYTVMGIEDQVVKSCFMTPFPSIQQALAAAFNELGNSARIYIIPDAGAVVPIPINP
ncbi:nickel-dependent lactate racemase [candidate division WOR-3 bacterium]|nr:nickel-dependent lactate racemase [candidate division WOR-3 bacterium]